MIPKKPNDLIRKYADQVGIPFSDIEDMITGYYKAIRINASELNHWNIRIRGIGDLRSSYTKVSRDYFKYCGQKERNEKNKQSPEYKEACEKLKNLSKIMQSYREEREKEEKVRKKKAKFHIEKRKNENK